ncbi:MAG: ATP-dependent DNA ligase [Chthoniobacterales bacterium]|nr:ATP-dependent DNA ligase [Chthoniobacterales bacterium]
MTLRESRTMNAIKKPMLAGKCERPEALNFPVLATPKLDGIRCLKIGGRALTRSFKPISNTFAREWIEANLPDGVDGELMLRGGTFNATTSAIGRESGEPDFVFHVFDFVNDGLDVPYACRVRELERLPEWDHVAKVLPVEIRDADELAAFEERCLAEGYEGVMVRDPAGPYKCGRSTEREGWLLKIKRFEDAEAVVLESYEGMSNQNEAERDAFGRTKRSLSKAGMVGRGELGGFVVRVVDTGVEFRLGYNHVLGGVDRVSLWERREELVGRLVKFRHQPSGAKDAPRFPKFVGWREAWDL